MLRQLWRRLPAPFCLLLFVALLFALPAFPHSAVLCRQNLPWTSPSCHSAMPPQGVPSNLLLESWPLDQGEAQNIKQPKKLSPICFKLSKDVVPFLSVLGLCPSVRWPVGQEWWSVGWSVWPPRGKCLNAAVHQTDLNRKLRVKRDNVRFSLSICNRVLYFCISSRVTRGWLRMSFA